MLTFNRVSVILFLMLIVFILPACYRNWFSRGREKYIQARQNLGAVMELRETLAEDIEWMAANFPAAEEQWQERRDAYPESVREKVDSLFERAPGMYEDLVEANENLEEIQELAKEFDKNVQEVNTIAGRTLELLRRNAIIISELVRVSKDLI